MPTQAYERYGLTGNPFRDLAAESVEDVATIHVNQEIDETLRTIREEVLDKENHAVVAVTGALGSGKTERLILAASEGRERGAFTVYYDLTNRTDLVLRGLASEIRKTAETAKIPKTFSSPAWLRAIGALEKGKDVNYDPKQAGQTIATALNERAPSLLLLNDLHNLVEKSEVDVFVEALQEMVDAIKPGVLVMFCSYESYLAWLTVNHPAFSTRINRTFTIRALSNEEAGAVLAKKMLAKRVVEDLDPIFPFDSEAVKALNWAASGNPRRLLELADLAIERGVAHRSYRIDADLVRAVVTQRPIPTEERLPPSTHAEPPKGTPAPASPAVPKKAASPPGSVPAWSESKNA